MDFVRESGELRRRLFDRLHDEKGVRNAAAGRFARGLEGVLLESLGVGIQGYVERAGVKTGVLVCPAPVPCADIDDDPAGVDAETLPSAWIQIRDLRALENAHPLPQ